MPCSIAGGGGFTSLCQTERTFTYGWIKERLKELGNKLGPLIEFLSTERARPRNAQFAFAF